MGVSKCKVPYIDSLDRNGCVYISMHGSVPSLYYLEALHFSVVALSKDERKLLLCLFSDIFLQKILNIKILKWQTLSSVPLRGWSHQLRQPLAPCMLQGGRCTCSPSSAACNALHLLPKQLPQDHRDPNHFWSKWPFLCSPLSCRQVTVPISETGAQSWSSTALL